MRFQKSFLVFLVIFLSPLPAFTANERNKFGVVERVVDGDTVKVRLDDGELVTVRLYGIDTPERKEPFAEEATAFAKKLVGLKRVMLQTRGKGTYGRVLAFVLRWQDRRWWSLNKELVRHGLAELYLGRFSLKSDITFNEYLELEGAALNKRIGIWSRPGKRKKAPYRPKD